MIAKQIQVEASELGHADARVWQGVREQRVELIGAPLGMQPSQYIVASRQEMTVGRVERLSAKALHNGRQIAIRLEWEDGSRDDALTDTTVFPDGAALLFPLKDDAPLITMGAEAQPVNAWHWRADRPGHARSNVATGLGTSRLIDENSVTADASWSAGRWRMVFVRDIEMPSEMDTAVQFSTGKTGKVAFAVWEGANGERGGLKAFSPQWESLTLES